MTTASVARMSKAISGSLSLSRMSLRSCGLLAGMPSIDSLCFVNKAEAYNIVRGPTMSWKYGTGEIFNPGHDANETISGLVNDDGAKILYVPGEGVSPPTHSIVFRYQDKDLAVAIIATRYANYHGPFLRSDGQSWTDAWVVNLGEKMIAPKAGVVVSREMIERIKANVESALLSHPKWPRDYGEPWLPARSVIFLSLD